MKSLEIERRSVKKVKDFICFNTYLRVVNQVIFKEYIYPLLEFKSNKNWNIKASKRLKEDHGIYLCPMTLKKHLRDLINGKRLSVAASDFISGFSYKNSPLSRYEKDSVYARLDLLTHLYIYEDINYIGLPANQLLYCSHKYSNIVACERNIDMARFMYKMKSEFIKNKNVDIIHGDILDYLAVTDKKFNLFDFDFMCAINSEILNKLANCIARTAMKTSIISIVSIGGRRITIKEYERLMPYSLIFKLENKGFKIITKPFSGRYKDHKFPMRYELFTIKHLENDNGR